MIAEVLVREFSEYNVQDDKKGDTPKLGGKIKSLVKLKKELEAAGVNTAKGVAVEVGAFRLFLDANPYFKALVGKLDESTLNESLKTAAELQQLIETATMPDTIAEQIRQAYLTILGEGTVVAVRSSGTAEDLADASYAGQHATKLGVKGVEDVIQAVLECWASLYGARAMLYRNEHGFKHSQVGMAVAIQELVRSEISGVMFTANPHTRNRNELVINAIRGLGELLVSGETDADEFILEKYTGTLKDRKIARQFEEMVYDETIAATRRTLVPADEQTALKLKREQVSLLLDDGNKIERHYGRPMDVEWAFAKGRLIILQARPVTGLDVVVKTQEEPIQGKLMLHGIGVSQGVVTGRVRIIRSEEEFDLFQKGEILVARMTAPDWEPVMQKSLGIITEVGGKLSHTAIVARESGIPAVVSADGAMSFLTTGTVVTVDGTSGRIYIRENGVAAKFIEEEVARAQQQQRDREAQQQLLRARSGSFTTQTKVTLIAADPQYAKEYAEWPADGIALLRTEFAAAKWGVHPGEVLENGQEEGYVQSLTNTIAAFCEELYPRPVVVRAPDFKTNEYRLLKGGDKHEEIEANPMMGVRGAFRLRNRRREYLLDCMAYYRVRYERKLDNMILMFPFVRTVDDFAQALSITESFGLRRVNGMKFWVMGEVPANIYQVRKLAQLGASGLSIGSNDLTQGFYLSDRDGNRQMQQTYSEAGEEVLMAMETLITTANDCGMYTSICGQLPSNHQDVIPLLIDWGIKSIGVNPDVFFQVREQVHAYEVRRNG